MDDDQRILSGLRVFELTTAVAGPVGGRYLAYHGAEVIKCESLTNPDIVRLFGSAWARTEELAELFFDTSPYLPEMAAGKKSVGLELKDPGGLEAARTLIAGSDVFLSNYTDGALVNLGMTYDDLKPLNERLVYISMPGFGTDPSLPYYPFRAFGPNQAPLVGFDALTGYADEDPAGIASIAPPDYVAGMHAVLAILSALEHRDITGEGSRIVVSQLETTVSLLGPYLLDHAITGTVPQPNGNRLAWAVPTGVYPCRGRDKHIALSVGSDEEWAALAQLIDGDGGGPLADAALADRATRWERHDEIDAAIAAWAAGLTAPEAAEQLQRVGVAAYEVLDHRGVLADPQIQDRKFYDVEPSPRFGRDLFTGHPIRLSETPGRASWAGPNIGQHTREVLAEQAGLSDAEIDALVERGAAFVARQPERQLERPADRFYEAMGLVEYEEAE